jgi:hypothetical protein
MPIVSAFGPRHPSLVEPVAGEGCAPGDGDVAEPAGCHLPSRVPAAMDRTGRQMVDPGENEVEELPQSNKQSSWSLRLLTCEVTLKLTPHGLAKPSARPRRAFMKNQAAFDLGAGVSGIASGKNLTQIISTPANSDPSGSLPRPLKAAARQPNHRPSYSARRSAMAKKLGLGRRPRRRTGGNTTRRGSDPRSQAASG